ncbi:hypothetical protein [Mesorhizobium huakuii]|uniref:Uncharacterized protein n=1 Tax=Mesorhizobium huakuii TaxID=28104 RepID=A0A7G6T482_9HYPH|nr:hypothetical protein [Mesorhizobium huakuii]QND61564.1 hypothetical protein HB778_35180 [Mesorhizobium huakuii]
MQTERCDPVIRTGFPLQPGLAIHQGPVANEKPKGKAASGSQSGPNDVGAVSKPRPDVTRKGIEMIGELCTDALHEALVRAPIEDVTLIALLVLKLAGCNISIQSGASDDIYGYTKDGSLYAAPRRRQQICP